MAKFNLSLYAQNALHATRWHDPISSQTVHAADDTTPLSAIFNVPIRKNLINKVINTLYHIPCRKLLPHARRYVDLRLSKYRLRHASLWCYRTM